MSIYVNVVDNWLAGAWLGLRPSEMVGRLCDDDEKYFFEREEVDLRDGRTIVIPIPFVYVRPWGRSPPAQASTVDKFTIVELPYLLPSHKRTVVFLVALEGQLQICIAIALVHASPNYCCRKWTRRESMSSQKASDSSLRLVARARTSTSTLSQQG
eukprot:scaffold771_cov147-Skeletonema_menzelii.AAC.2